MIPVSRKEQGEARLVWGKARGMVAKGFEGVRNVEFHCFAKPQML